MNTFNKKTRLNWRRVLFAASAIAVVALSAVAYPLVREALTARKVQSAKAIYATGLSPCEFHSDNIDTLLRKHLPAAPAASITVHPAFSDTVAIRLVGQDLYYFVLEFPLNVPGDERHPKFNSNGVPTIYKSHVSTEIARQLPQVLGNDIKHAQAELPLGLDGTTYFFQTSPASCAMTWSPRSGTRAEKFAKLFAELADHAQAGNKTDSASEQAILAILKSLQTE
ncbi:MAG: hypothetical protein ACREO1_02675 [Arenimonas sp.]